MVDDLDPFEARLRDGLEQLRPTPERSAVDRRFGFVTRLGRRRRQRRRIAAVGAAAVAAVMAVVLTSVLGGMDGAVDRVDVGGRGGGDHAEQEGPSPPVDARPEESTTTTTSLEPTSTTSLPETTVSARGPGPGSTTPIGVTPGRVPGVSSTTTAAASPPAVSVPPGLLPLPAPCVTADARATGRVTIDLYAVSQGSATRQPPCFVLSKDGRLAFDTVPADRSFQVRWAEPGTRERILVTIPKGGPAPFDWGPVSGLGLTGWAELYVYADVYGGWGDQGSIWLGVV